MLTLTDGVHIDRRLKMLRLITLVALLVSSAVSAQEIKTHRSNNITMTNFNDSDYRHLTMQLSLRSKLSGPLNIGYTQKSLWDIYEPSSPFRETVYNPELFIKIRLMDFGYEHESNGMDRKNSRSWERMFLRTYYVQGKTTIGIKTWKPFFIHENEDLVKYQGTWESYVVVDSGKVSFYITNRIKSSKLEIFYDAGDFYIYTNIFNGYGGNGMIDFDTPSYTTSIGIALNKGGG